MLRTCLRALTAADALRAVDIRDPVHDVDRVKIALRNALAEAETSVLAELFALAGDRRCRRAGPDPDVIAVIDSLVAGPGAPHESDLTDTLFRGNAHDF